MADDIETKKQEAVDFIAEATKRLKGPLSNIERAWLVADRKDARAYLSKLERASTAGLGGR